MGVSMLKVSHITAMIHQARGKFVSDPYDINCGQCEEFATYVVDQLGGETHHLYPVWIEDMLDTPYPDAAHKVVCFHSMGVNIYFDAECPNGTTNLDRLPLIANRGRTRGEVLAGRLV